MVDLLSRGHVAYGEVELVNELSEGKVHFVAGKVDTEADTATSYEMGG